jgi:nucleoside-diphosphate-sugar epimerase
MAEPEAVILGASGFIGTRLVAKLANEGRSVVALDIVPPRVAVRGVSYQLADVRGPLPCAAAKGARVLYNLAAVHRTPGHPDDAYYETNVLGALNATTLAERCGIGTIVFTSSCSVYGASETLVDESSPLLAVSAYGRSKRLAELIHHAWQTRAPGRRLITARPGVVFGPGEQGNYSRLARALERGYFVYPGRKHTAKSGGYVDELLETVDFALAKPEANILYNFTFPEISTTEDIVRALGLAVGRVWRPATAPLPLMLAAARGFEALNAIGIKNPVHRERILKLVVSTRIAPGWLLENGYEFRWRLETALAAWAKETAGRFD